VSQIAATADNGLAAAALKLQLAAASAAKLGVEPLAGSQTKPRAAPQSPAAARGDTAKAVTLGVTEVLAFDPVQGLIDTPAIDEVSEISNQMAAGQAFAASVKALKTADDEQQTLLDISA
jgi:hypothetical protein